MVGMWPTDFHSLLVSGGGHRSWAEAISSEVKTLYRPCYNNGPGCPRRVFFGSGWLVVFGADWKDTCFFCWNFRTKTRQNVESNKSCWGLGTTIFFLGVLELRTPEIVCLYSTLLLGKICFATNRPSNDEHPTTNSITLHVMIFLWTKGHLILRGVPVLHSGGIYKYTSIDTQSLRLGYKK